MRMVDELMTEANLTVAALDGIAFGAGPGSFTGVRIAAAVAQGIALACDLPVGRVSTLAALAQGTWRELGARHLLPAIDARKQEIYWACYRVLDGDDTVTCICPDALGPIDSINLPEPGAWVGIGTGWVVYREALLARTGSQVELIESIRYPHATDVAALGVALLASGQAVRAEEALPSYLRAGI